MQEEQEIDNIRQQHSSLAVAVGLRNLADFDEPGLVDRRTTVMIWRYFSPLAASPQLKTEGLF